MKRVLIKALEKCGNKPVYTKGFFWNHPITNVEQNSYYIELETSRNKPLLKNRLVKLLKSCENRQVIFDNTIAGYIIEKKDRIIITKAKPFKLSEALFPNQY